MSNTQPVFLQSLGARLALAVLGGSNWHMGDDDDSDEEE